ncbi:MAG: YdeI/OmpD-associated family protein [Acidobacteria bacterium]|nr:YdeI/OmpD-associated family protein [Acidobacteriota bacterium]
MELPELFVPDAPAWREWLEEYHDRSPGVTLVLAKKGTASPTTLTYDQALDEALCVGWIDGRLSARDEATFRRRFTPRTSRSAWSARNVALVERLVAEGRMHPAGEAAVESARADGRWAAAYAGQRSMTTPDDLLALLRDHPTAAAAFEAMSRSERYSALYRLARTTTPEGRERRLTLLLHSLQGESTD